MIHQCHAPRPQASTWQFSEQLLSPVWQPGPESGRQGLSGSSGTAGQLGVSPLNLLSGGGGGNNALCPPALKGKDGVTLHHTFHLSDYLMRSCLPGLSRGRE